MPIPSPRELAQQVLRDPKVARRLRSFGGDAPLGGLLGGDFRESPIGTLLFGPRSFPKKARALETLAQFTSFEQLQATLSRRERVFLAKKLKAFGRFRAATGLTKAQIASLLVPERFGAAPAARLAAAGTPTRPPTQRVEPIPFSAPPGGPPPFSQRAAFSFTGGNTPVGNILTTVARWGIPAAIGALGGALEDFFDEGDVSAGSVPAIPPKLGGLPAATLPGGAPMPGVPAGMNGGASMAAGGACPTMFRPNRTTIRPARLVVQMHPQTGEPVFFGHLGRPILFSRDMAVARKVGRLARRARRVRGGR